ncbi:MAG: hypothetical protein NT116_01540 [Candidatus Parcubacteria bacterium]|nr:hypothetical protein [Candidatus Parcubacteria bacterium]
MPYLSGYEKFKIFLIYLITKYVVWIVIGAVIIIWYFFPNLVELIGQIIVFWAPASILLVCLFLSLTTNFFRLKKQKEQGRTQFEIIITNFDFFIVDIIVYGGSILMLILAFVLKTQGVEPIDLIFALIFFVCTNWLKQLFFNKIIR